MKKKIVHFITSLKRGGAETLLVDLITLLPEYEHMVMYVYDGANRIRLQELGVATYQIKSWICMYDPWFMMHAYSLLKQFSPDILHTSLWSANFLGRIFAKLLSIKCVSVIHLGVNQDGIVRNMLDALTFQLSQKVVAVSDAVAQSLIDKKYIAARNMCTILNGINIERLKRDAVRSGITRESLGLNNTHFVIGSVGRFIARKNYVFLIDLFTDIVREFPKAYLILVGFGSEEGALRLKAERNGIAESVIFQVGASGAGYFPLFDCFILPSTQEGLSIALLEAMSFSLPCIITDQQGHPVIIQGYNGFIASLGNKESFMRHIRFLINNPAEAKSIGVMALKTVKQEYSIERVSAEYRQLF